MPSLAESAYQHRKNRHKQRPDQYPNQQLQLQLPPITGSPPRSSRPPSSPRTLRTGVISPSRSFDDAGDDRPAIPQRTKSFDEGTHSSVEAILTHPIASISPNRSIEQVDEPHATPPSRPSNLQRMIQYLQQTTATPTTSASAHTRPVTPPTLTNLSPQETRLWEAVQQALVQAKKQFMDPNVTTQNHQHVTQERMEHMEQEHQRAVRALQRVLADVTAERDALLQTQAIQAPKSLQSVSSSGSSEVPSLASSSSMVSEDDKRRQWLALNDECARLQALVDNKNQQIQQLKSQQLFHPESLHKDLQAKTKALENAKMIITSLESASGSLAVDLRAKIRVKDDEIATVKSKNQSLQRQMDILAKDLKDMQHKFAEKEEQQYHDFLRRLMATSKIDRNLREVENFASVYESTQDPAALRQVVSQLREALITLRESQAALGHENQESILQLLLEQSPEVRALQRELEDKKKSLHHLEEEVARLRDSSISQHNRGGPHTHVAPNDTSAELQTLREKYRTNMEVLARKERELAVLRDSLRVDDEDVGYISDDASETDIEEDTGNAPPSSPSSSSFRITEYSPAHAEAIATLMVHGSSIEAIPQWGPSEVDLLRNELQALKVQHGKALASLQEEKETLLSAKMIISSLERANQDMRDDLRSRLQNSNTAIASLMERSMEREKSSDELRIELDRLKKENEEMKERYAEERHHRLLDEDDEFDEQALLHDSDDYGRYSLPEEICETID